MTVDIAIVPYRPDNAAAWGALSAKGQDSGSVMSYEGDDEA